MKCNVVEKIEISKNKGNFYFTGILTDLENGWVQIDTTRGETLRFRKEQVQNREVMKCNEGEDE